MNDNLMNDDFQRAVNFQNVLNDMLYETNIQKRKELSSIYVVERSYFIKKYRDSVPEFLRKCRAYNSYISFLLELDDDEETWKMLARIYINRVYNEFLDIVEFKTTDVLVENDFQNPSFWNKDASRVFISHLVKIKKQTAAFAEELLKFGIQAFVAHVDIEPTKKWLEEIELALGTMDVMVALISPDFTKSKWCDQEVGFAMGRNIPIIAVKLDQDPYGFIGKFQALEGKGKIASELATDIFNLLIVDSKIGLKLVEILIGKLRVSNSWDESKYLVDLISKSNSLNNSHFDSLKSILAENSQVSGAWDVPEKIQQLIDEVSV